jgi:hypothetical protein
MCMFVLTTRWTNTLKDRVFACRGCKCSVSSSFRHFDTAKQALYHLSHAPSLLFLFCFWNKVWLAFPELALNYDPPASASWVAGITCVHHHAWPDTATIYVQSLPCVWHTVASALNKPSHLILIVEI